MKHRMILRAPDGEGAGGGSATANPTATTPTTTETAPGGKAPTDPGTLHQQQASAAVSRPDWVPEKFWNAEKGEADVQNLAKSYGELESRIGLKDEDLRKTLSDEVRAELFKERPVNPEDYKLEFPADFVLPDGLQAVFDPADPLMAWYRKTAFDKGFSQAEFAEGLAAHFQSLNHYMPDHEQELAKLGEHGKERAERVLLWTKSNLSEKAVKVISAAAVTADVVEVIEEMMDKMGEPAFAPSTGGTTEAGLSLTELREMMKDPRYHNAAKRDPAFVAKVQEGFAKLAKAK
jgi:hypothetical protein